jgi:hypothetical protein
MYRIPGQRPGGETLATILQIIGLVAANPGKTFAGFTVVVTIITVIWEPVYGAPLAFHCGMLLLTFARGDSCEGWRRIGYGWIGIWVGCIALYLVAQAFWATLPARKPNQYEVAFQAEMARVRTNQETAQANAERIYAEVRSLKESGLVRELKIEFNVVEARVDHVLYQNLPVPNRERMSEQLLEWSHLKEPTVSQVRIISTNGVVLATYDQP